MNQELINNFEVLQKYYKYVNDKGRSIAYGKVIAALRTVNEPIVNVRQIKGVRGIGPKVQAKVKEFLETGRIRVVEEKREEMKEEKTQTEKERTIQKFKEIWGVGPAKAEELYSRGMRSINDIRENMYLLTASQKIGLKYYEDLLEKIPREKITVLFTVFAYYLNKKFGRGTYKMEIAGSYRRGKKMSGDIDLLISSDKFGLKDVVKLFKKKKIITDTLSMRDQKFMGIASCPSGGRHIRLDIEFVPEESWGSALLYFTGSKGTNVYMRGIAKKKGFLLNEHGIYRLSTGKKADERPSEEDIFTILGIPYIPPERR